MIGQEHLRNQLKSIYGDPKPRFLLLVGDKGSGKKTVLYDVFGGSALYITGVDNKAISIDQVRGLIDMANHMHDTLFVIFDIDRISTNAQNALLKIVEEPPNDNCFIATVSNSGNILPTIKSRAQTLYMDKYSTLEKQKIAESVIDSKYQDRIVDIVQICETPGDIMAICSYGPAEFINYIYRLYNNLPSSGLTNAFKSAEKIALKADSEGYDLALVWRGYKRICCNNISEYMFNGCKPQLFYDPERDFERIRITNEFLNTLRTTGVNKSMLFGAWVIKIINL